MSTDRPLPPQLERFVREQIALRRFLSESEVICAALDQFQKQYSSDSPIGPLPKRDRFTTLPETVGKRSPALALPNATSTTPSPGRRGPRGILSDLTSNISLDEILEARREMWSAFPHRAP